MKWIPKVDCGLFEAYDKGYVHVVKTVAYVHVVNSVTYFQANKNFEQKKIFPFKTLNLNPINGDDSTNWQVDMSKCMVAYIDWYHERIDGEGGREKIKVGDEIMISY